MDASIYIYSKTGYDVHLFSWFFFIYNFFSIFYKKIIYLVTYSVYVQYDDYYSAFVNGKKHLHVNIVTYSDVHNKHLFFFFNFFYFLQKNHIR